MPSRLIVDTSSILWANLLQGDDLEFGRDVQFEGKTVKIKSAIHGFSRFIPEFVNVLSRLQVQPRDVILVLDGRDSRALRKMFYPEYKGRREKRPPEQFAEFNRLLDEVKMVVKSLGGVVAWQDYMEADDVIAYLAKNLKGKQTIWSRDGDMLALRAPGIDILFRDDLNPEFYKGCPTEHILTFKSLVGDQSDNIPGAKQFREKKFQEMMVTFGVDGLSAMQELIEGRRLHELVEDVPACKCLQKVIDSAAMVYTSHACAKFYDERVNTARTPLQIETGICETFDPAKHPRELQQHYATMVLATPATFDSVASKAIHWMEKSEFIAFDVETSTGPESDAWVKAIAESATRGKKIPPVDVLGSELTGFSLTFGPNSQYTVYFPVDHADKKNITKDQAGALLAAIPDHVKVVVHNSSFELVVVKNEFDGWLANVYDTKLMKSYVNENTPLGLKTCSLDYLNYKQATYDEVTQGRKMRQLTAPEVFHYGCDDTRCTAALFSRFRFTMELENSWDAFEEVELTAQYWVADSFIRGVECDYEELARLSAEDDEVYDEAWGRVRQYLFDISWPGTRYEPFEASPAGFKKAFKIATGKLLECRARLPHKIIAEIAEQGAPELADILVTNDPDEIDSYLKNLFEGEPEFDITKDAHMRHLMFEVMKLPVRFETDKMKLAQVSFDAVEHALQLDVEKGSREEEVLRAIREMNVIGTRRGLYYQPYPLLRHWKTGRLHSQLGQCQAATRRFTPAKPNVNQLPKRGEGIKVRRTLKAPPGQLWVSMDWRGQELRLAAERSGDEALMSCFVGDDPRDPHSLVGADIAAKAGSEFDTYEVFIKNLDHPDVKKFRASAKTTNFLSQYLGQAKGLARKLVCEVEDAQRFLDSKNAVYFGLAAWQERTKVKAHTLGYTETLLGVRRHLADKILSSDKWVQREAERQGVNFEIQGSGAEMVKLSINAMWRQGLLEDPRCRFVFPVHDEGDLLVQLEAAEEIIPKLHACMVQPYADMKIPIESELKIGFDFGSLVEVGTNPTPENIRATIASLTKEAAFFLT